MQRPTACIIGAGSSGIPCIKALRDAEIDVTCFEMGDVVGGNWAFGNSNGINNIYKSLHINTSRTRMEYADYAMPEEYPDFPGHTEIADYFNMYLDEFDLRRHIEFNTRVDSCRLLSDNGWEIELQGGDIRYFDMLLVANGHHWDPKLPEPPFPGDFTGETFHSHDYIDPKTPLDLFDKNVVVLGMGNSAVDIASEISRRGIAKNTYLCGRRGAWIVPNYIFGKPMDLMPVNNPLLHPAVPWSIRRVMLNSFVKLITGDMQQYGLPKPAHEFVEAHPTISSELPIKLGRGDVKWMSNIKELRGDKVLFTNGEEHDVDVIIYCTGYNVTFPFFAESFLSAPGNDLPLFKRIFKPEIPSLAFIGLLQPLGAVMPIAEAQAKLVADYLTGKYALPSRDEMQKQMGKDRAVVLDRYVASRRHTMQVDYDDYRWDLDKERAAGARRAAKSTQPLSVVPKAYIKELTKNATGGQLA